MIYTVTFNPSLDYVIQDDDPGYLGSEQDNIRKNLPGGKGNNVSVILCHGTQEQLLDSRPVLPESRWKPCWKEFGCYTDFIPLEEGADQNQ